MLHRWAFFPRGRQKYMKIALSIKNSLGNRFLTFFWTRMNIFVIFCEVLQNCAIFFNLKLNCTANVGLGQCTLPPFQQMQNFILDKTIIFYTSMFLKLAASFLSTERNFLAEFWAFCGATNCRDKQTVQGKWCREGEKAEIKEVQKFCHASISVF